MIVADPDDALTLPEGVPVSVVTRVSANARNIRLVNAAPPGAVLAGQEAIVSAEFEAVGLKGEASTIELDQDGVRLAATEHRWTLDRERFTARLGYVPPAAGIVKVTVAARSAKGEASGEDTPSICRFWFVRERCTWRFTSQGPRGCRFRAPRDRSVRCSPHHPSSGRRAARL